MAKSTGLPKKATALLIYMRPVLVFGGLIFAIAVMWTRNPVLYTLGVSFLFISMSLDLVDGWFAVRYHPYPQLAELADRIMDKLVYAMLFPMVAVGMMWRLVFISPDHTRIDLLHAILILLLCVTVLIRDNFAHFMRGFAIRQGQEPEASELNRLRTMVAAPVGALLYAHAFYIPEGPPSQLYAWISWLGNLPLRGLFLIEIIFLTFNLGSIAGYCRKYGTYCLDELCLGDTNMRRRLLTFFPNALTVMNAMMGLLAVFFAYQDRIREAYLILIGAALFDKLDGALSRKLGLTELPASNDNPKRINLGSILDDIADAVSFCIVPAWIFHIHMSVIGAELKGMLSIGLVAWIYALAGFARLTYFTLDKTPIPGFFKGLPSPAAALMVVAPLMFVGQGSTPDFPGGTASAVGIMLAGAVLMNVYPIRYIHYGRFMNRHPLFVGLTFLVGFILIFTPYFGHFSLFCLSIYLVSPLWTWRVRPDVAARESRAEEA